MHSTYYIYEGESTNNNIGWLELRAEIQYTIF